MLTLTPCQSTPQCAIPEWFRVVTTLKNNGLVLLPTDTGWFLAASLYSSQACNRLNALRPWVKSTDREVLMPSLLHLMAAIPHLHPRLHTLLLFLERPLGIEEKACLPGLGSSRWTYRIAKDAFCQQIMKEMKAPLLLLPAGLPHEPHASGLGRVSSCAIEAADYIPLSRGRERLGAKPCTVVCYEDGLEELIFVRE